MRESGWCPQGSSRGNDRFQGVHKTIFRERERERENNKRKIGCIWLQNVFTKKKNKNSGFPSPTSMCTWKSRKFVPGQPLSKHMWKKLVFLTYSWHILTCLADRLSDGNVCACLLFGPFVSPKCWVKRGHLPLLWMVTFEPGPGNADMWNTQVTWQRSPVLACWRDRCPKIIRLLLKNKMSYLYKSFWWIHVYGTSISLSRCSLISHAVIQSHHEVLLLRARASQVGAKLGRPTLQEFHMEPAQTCFLFPRWFFSPTLPMLIHVYPFSEGPLAMWNFEGPIPYATFLPQSCRKIWRAAASGSFHGSPLKWGWISGRSFRNSRATLPDTHRRVGGLLMAQNWPTIQGREPRRLSCWNHLASPGELIWLGERAPCPLLCVATVSHPILAHWCDSQTPWPWFATYVLTNISRTIN